MINVLFVCLGNICRSPVAEGVLRHLVEKQGLSGSISCDSAGTASYHLGELPDRRTRENALEHGIRLTHRARRLTGEDFARFQYFVAMDESNYEAIQYTSHRSTGFYSEDSTFLLREFDPLAEDPDQGGPNVPDPYYEDAECFEQVFQIVYRSCEQLLAYLVEQHQLQPNAIPQGRSY